MLPAQFSCCHAMCLRLEPLESNSFNPHDVIPLSFGEVLCVVASLASVKCSGGWETDWGYCLWAIGWDAVILSLCFLLFDGDRNEKQTMEGLGWPEGPRGFDEVISNGYALQKLTFLAYSLWINCKLEADAIKSYELLIAMWCIMQTARLLFSMLSQRRSFEILILNAASFSFFCCCCCWWQSFSEICTRSLSLFLPLPL